MNFISSLIDKGNQIATQVAGANNKILNEDSIYESLVSFKRAGASAIITYFADQIADKLR